MALSTLWFQYYESRSLPFSAQRLVNLFWETAPQPAGTTKSPGVLFRRPGESEFATDIGNGTIRGAHKMGDYVYVVSGKQVYKVDTNGTVTFVPGDEMLGFEIVDMVDNGTQIAVVNGSNGYIITSSAVTQITDANFPDVSSVTFSDGYFIWTEANSGRFILSPLYDGTGPYDPLDVATAEYGPDNLVKAFADHNDLLLFGEDTTEPWYVVSTGSFPYEPNPGTATEVGLVTRQTVKKIGNIIMYLGTNKEGNLMVYKQQGYVPVPVATPPICRKLDAAGAEIDQAYADVFSVEGHHFYILTIPDYVTFVYDTSTGLWCEWQTRYREDWARCCFVYAFGKRLIGDRRGNRLLELSMDYFDDAGELIPWMAISAPLASGNNAISRHNFFRVDVGAGIGLTSGQGVDPAFWLDWAEEDGERFGNKRLLKMGAKGATQTRAFARRLGKARSRTYRISGTDPVALSILGAYVDITKGKF